MSTPDTASDPFAASEGNLGLSEVIKEPKRAPKVKAEVTERRTKIVLEDNEQIPPTGQFFGADGRGYMLRPGEAAEVPDSILNILDTAVTSVPVTDSSQTVIGYRDRLRFPYRVVTERRAA